MGTVKSYWHQVFFILSSDLLNVISWSAHISKSQIILWVSFSRSDSGLGMYQKVVWSNFNVLHNSQWILFPTQSCLVLYFFSTSLLHSLTIWLIFHIFLNKISFYYSVASHWFWLQHHLSLRRCFLLLLLNVCYYFSVSLSVSYDPLPGLYLGWGKFVIICIRSIYVFCSFFWVIFFSHIDCSLLKR